MSTIAKTDIRLIAFYLPQYHPIPENDLWWGKGFTEWTNVTQAEPQFPGHYQPQLPTDLGFYDLRLRQTRHEQIKLAKNYGIDGFCYYYYWFSGKRLLDEPLDDMLGDPNSDMPFCLCWANENWTRRWDGRDSEVLIAQKYAIGDDLAFIRSIAPFLKDRRYIKVENKPILLVYSPQKMPDAKMSAKVWRNYCRENDIGEINIFCCFTSGNWDYQRFGYDGGIEFPPHPPKHGHSDNLRPDVNHFAGFNGHLFSASAFGAKYLQHDHAGRNVYRGVFPSWDNTARRNHRAAIALNGTPENYEFWLSEALTKTKLDHPTSDRLVFINAWNEWAEGCHLEPCVKYGRRFLEATSRAKAGLSKLTGWTHIGVPSQAQLTDDQRSRQETFVGRIRRKIFQKLR